jgi:hypothetical protein
VLKIDSEVLRETFDLMAGDAREEVRGETLLPQLPEYRPIGGEASM